MSTFKYKSKEDKSFRGYHRQSLLPSQNRVHKRIENKLNDLNLGRLPLRDLGSETDSKQSDAVIPPNLAKLSFQPQGKEKKKTSAATSNTFSQGSSPLSPLSPSLTGADKSPTRGNLEIICGLSESSLSESNSVNSTRQSSSSSTSSSIKMGSSAMFLSTIEELNRSPCPANNKDHLSMEELSRSPHPASNKDHAVKSPSRSSLQLKKTGGSHFSPKPMQENDIFVVSSSDNSDHSGVSSRTSKKKMRVNKRKGRKVSNNNEVIVIDDLPWKGTKRSRSSSSSDLSFSCKKQRCDDIIDLTREDSPPFRPRVSSSTPSDRNRTPELPLRSSLQKLSPVANTVKKAIFEPCKRPNSETETENPRAKEPVNDSSCGENGSVITSYVSALNTPDIYETLSENSFHSCMSVNGDFEEPKPSISSTKNLDLVKGFSLDLNSEEEEDDVFDEDVRSVSNSSDGRTSQSSDSSRTKLFQSPIGSMESPTVNVDSVDGCMDTENLCMGGKTSPVAVAVAVSAPEQRMGIASSSGPDGCCNRLAVETQAGKELEGMKLPSEASRPNIGEGTSRLVEFVMSTQQAMDSSSTDSCWESIRRQDILTLLKCRGISTKSVAALKQVQYITSTQENFVNSKLEDGTRLPSQRICFVVLNLCLFTTRFRIPKAEILSQLWLLTWKPLVSGNVHLTEEAVNKCMQYLIQLLELHPPGQNHCVDKLYASFLQQVVGQTSGSTYSLWDHLETLIMTLSTTVMATFLIDLLLADLWAVVDSKKTSTPLFVKLFWKDKGNNITLPIRKLMDAIDSVSVEWKPLTLTKPDKKIGNLMALLYMASTVCDDLSTELVLRWNKLNIFTQSYLIGQVCSTSLRSKLIKYLPEVQKLHDSFRQIFSAKLGLFADRVKPVCIPVSGQRDGLAASGESMDVDPVSITAAPVPIQAKTAVAAVSQITVAASCSTRPLQPNSSFLPLKNIAESTGTRSIPSGSRLPIQANHGNKCSNNNTASRLLTDHATYRKKSLGNSSNPQQDHKKTHSILNKQGQSSMAVKKSRSKSATEVSSDHYARHEMDKIKTGGLVNGMSKVFLQSTGGPLCSRSDQAHKKPSPLTQQILWKQQRQPKAQQPHNSSSKLSAVPSRRSSVNLPVSNKKVSRANEKNICQGPVTSSDPHTTADQHSNKSILGSPPRHLPQSVPLQAHQKVQVRTGSGGGMQGVLIQQGTPQKMASSPKLGSHNQLQRSWHKDLLKTNASSLSPQKPRQDHRPPCLSALSHSSRLDQQKEKNKPHRRQSVHASAKLARLSEQHEETRRTAEPPQKSHLSPVKKTPNLMHFLPMDRTKSKQCPITASPTKVASSRKPECQTANTCQHKSKEIAQKTAPKSTYQLSNDVKNLHNPTAPDLSRPPPIPHTPPRKHSSSTFGKTL